MIQYDILIYFVYGIEHIENKNGITAVDIIVHEGRVHSGKNDRDDRTPPGHPYISPSSRVKIDVEKQGIAKGKRTIVSKCLMFIDVPLIYIYIYTS